MLMSLILSTGIPSIMYNGFEPLVILFVPRTFMLNSAPGKPEDC